MTQSNDTANDKDNPLPKAAATTPVVPNHPVEAGDAKTGKADPKPTVDSVLVGKPRTAAREPAKPKAASSVPAVEAAKPAEAVKAAHDKATSQPAPAPQPAPQVVEKVVRKGGFGATFLGGVVAAALGAGAAYYAIPQLPAAWQPVAPVPQADPAEQIDAARAAAAETAKSELAAAHDQMVADATNAGSQAGSTAGAEAARQALIGQQQPTAAVDLAAIEGQLVVQAQRLDALDKRLSAAPVATPGQAASTASVAPPASGDLQALQDALAQLQGRVTAQDEQIRQLAAQPSLDPRMLDEIRMLSAQAEQISTAAQSAETMLAAAQAEAQRVRQDTETVGRRAQIVAATATLRMALESGGGLDAGISDLQGSGVTVPAALASDVPTLPYLQRDFDAAARAGLNASLKANSQGQGAMGAIGNFLRVQTGARSVEPREGTDPDAILSRVGADVQRGDVKAALAGIATLPAAGQNAMAGWTADAQKWVAASAALDEIAASAK